MSSCPPIPTFVPSACGISDINVAAFRNPTSRAARKAVLNPSLRAGQLQSSRLDALKRCVIQVNASEVAFRQASWGKVQLIDTVPTTFYTFPPILYQYLSPVDTRDTKFLPAQPTTQISTYDPSGNLYTFVNNAGIASVTRYSTDISGVVNLSSSITGAIFNLPANLTSANLFWSPSLRSLVFVGVFFNVNTSVQIYTFNVSLTASLSPIRIPLSQNGRQYSGQAMCNSAGVIYIALCASGTVTYEPAPVFIVSANLSVVQSSNLQLNYTSIQQTAGDTLGGAAITAYSPSGPNTGINLSYFTDKSLAWRTTFVGSGPCGINIINNTDIAPYGINNYILMLYTVGPSVLCKFLSYTITGFKTVITNPVTIIPPPFTTPFKIVSISVSQSPSVSRFFYTMYMTNLTLPNYEFYMQTGEFTVGGTILWSINVQIGDTYIVSPSNIIQTSPTTLAVCYGLELTTFMVGYYAPSTTPVLNYGTLDISYCVVRSIKNVCPCAPTADVSAATYDIRSSLQHTLGRAICNPMVFTNPVATNGCAPVYTPPTKFLTSAEGAEPPLGPGVESVSRQFQSISGIDQICRPPAPRFSSLRTARIRAGIQSQTDTRYVNTVLPVVQYPPLCPVYGNQSGIPVASLCQPAIDSRPTTLR